MAQNPYAVLRQTTTTGRSNNTAATTSNSNASYYQPRAGQTDGYGFGSAPPPPASYMSYYSQLGGTSGTALASGSGYSTNAYPAGPSSFVASTSPSTVPGTSAHGAAASTSHQKPAFRAPAHKHAHHLHSIPPREKSTRTLIIDHMLWAHGMSLIPFRGCHHIKMMLQGGRDLLRLVQSWV